MQQANPQIETHVVKPQITLFENGVEYRMIPFSDELSMDAKINEIERYINTNHGKDKTEFEKDTLYATAQTLWKEYVELFKKTKFSFYLNNPQYDFLINALRDDIEYNVDTIFLGIELTNMLGEWFTKGNPESEKEIRSYEADATDVTWILHLISKHKVKGLTHEAYRFSEVLIKLSQLTRIITYYDTHAKNLKKEIELWTASFDETVDSEGNDYSQVDTEKLQTAQ